MIKVTVIKTLAKMEENDINEYSCQVLRFAALSNDQFEVDVYDMYLSEALDYGSYPAWCHNDDNEKPKYTRRFNDFLSANANLDKLSIGYTQVSSSDPIDAAEELFSLERDNEIKEEQEYCKAQHIKDEEESRKKQKEYEKKNRFEATCKITGNRALFAAETKEKALKMAELYFSGEVLKIEKVNLN